MLPNITSSSTKATHSAAVASSSAQPESPKARETRSSPQASDDTCTRSVPSTSNARPALKEPRPSGRQAQASRTPPLARNLSSGAIDGVLSIDLEKFQFRSADSSQAAFQVPMVLESAAGAAPLKVMFEVYMRGGRNAAPSDRVMSATFRSLTDDKVPESLSQKIVYGSGYMQITKLLSRAGTSDAVAFNTYFFGEEVAAYIKNNPQA